MKVWTPIFNLVAAVLILLLSASYLNMCEVIDRDFEQERFNYAVQQATEAMFRRTLKAEDIDLDYQDMSYIQIDSSNALEVFDRVMCANYNMAPSPENFSAVNDSIAACVIAGYDGYYILRYSEADILKNGVAADGYLPKFSVKIPYLITGGNNLYALDSYKRTYTAMSLNNKNASPVLNVTGGDWPPGTSEDQVKKDINQQVRAAILDELRQTKNVSLGTLDEFSFIFPDETTVSGVNPFDVPAIFIIMDGAQYASTHELRSMPAAGYKVIQKIQVIGFQDKKSGRYYYCYEGQMRDDEKTAASGGIPIGGGYGDFEIINYFGSAKEAAEAEIQGTNEHYAPYYELLIRKSSKDTTD